MFARNIALDPELYDRLPPLRAREAVRGTELDMAKLASALSFHLSRKQEFEADDMAVELTHPKEVSAALEKITALNEELLTKELEKLPYADHWQFQPRNTTWLWDPHPPYSEPGGTPAEPHCLLKQF